SRSPCGWISATGPCLTPIRPRTARSTPVGWRSFFRIGGLLAALGLASAGCGKSAVRASEKEFLADRIMRFDSDPQESAADRHVVSNREGAAGGAGTGGGGCGCN